MSYSQRAIRREADRHEKQPAPLSALDDRDQTGLETPAHDAERTDVSSTTDTPQISWPKRLEDLARRAATAATSSAPELDGETARSIHHHLDALESILGDSHPESTLEVAQSGSRSQSARSKSVGSDISRTEESVQAIVSTVPTEPEQCDGIKKEEILSQLQALLGEVTALNEEVDRRRKESSLVRDLFEERCRGLTRTVAELKDEVLEL